MLASLRPESGHGSPRRKVLLTTDAVGGVWTYALDLAAGLRALGFVTTLAVLGPEPSPVQLAEAQRIADIEVIVTRLRGDFSGIGSVRVVASLENGEELSRSEGIIIHPGQHEIVHAISAAWLRQLPVTTVRMRITASAEGKGQPVAEYTLLHEGSLRHS